MFMEPGNCITYSLVVPASLVEGLSFERSYAFLDQWVMGALAEVGITARYVPLNDIASDKGKIAGAAQKRFADGTVVHHVTMAYDIDAEKMVQVLRIGREDVRQGNQECGQAGRPARSQTGMTRAAILTSFENYFRSQHDTRTSAYTESELAQARELVETKFNTEKWTHRVP